MPKRLLLFFSVFLLASLALPEHSFAAPGDTTRVTIFNRRRLDHYGAFDTTTVMPAAGRSYRKILMHYILGRYACPPGTVDCGSWDYTTRLIVRPAGRDTVEMARIMTPYANDWLGRNKTHDYVVDVTDYAPLLTGTPGMRFDYQGYSWGFTVTVRLDFIEGTPPQDPVDVRNAYAGTFAYGSTTDPIESHLPARSLVSPSAGTITLKNLISGHGSDAVNCAEFCNRYYRLYLNGQVRLQKALWRDDCGKNEVYPQTGTWVYNRGNWCPGAVVRPIWHELTPIVGSGQPYTLDIDMQAYVGNGAANYIWSSQIVTRGAINYATDASLDEIITPNSNENYYRENPNCGGPQVRIRNLGRNRLTAVNITYGVAGRGATQTYAWTGNLSFGRDTLVVLPALLSLLSNNGGRFRAWTTGPNGSRDQNAYNDTLSTKFAPTISLPTNFTVSMLTNNTNASGIGGTNETSWQITDVAGNVVAQRQNPTNSTLYNDPQQLPAGCYSLRLTDLGCNGFSWWAAASQGSGTFRLLDSSGNVLQTLSGDFGCEYQLNFRINSGLATTPAAIVGLDIFPNPSHDGNFTLDLNLPVRQDIRLNVTDALGRSVWSQQLAQVKATKEPLALRNLAPGVYALEVTLADGSKVNRRLAID